MRLLLPLPMLALFCSPAPAQSPPSYAKHVQPFFTRYCVECHNSKEPEGGLNLESYKALQEGGGRGAAVAAGKPDVSRLVRMVEGKAKPVMPPKKSKQPPRDEVSLVRAWVLAGARDDSTLARVTLPAVLPKRKPPTPVSAAAYSPDGKTLAAAGRGEVLLLDAATGEVTSRVAAGRDRVTALAYSPAGLLAVAASTAGAGHEVRIQSRVIARHDDVIQDVAFSPDGKTLATASYDRVIKLWDVASGKEVNALRDHSDSAYGVCFSPDGKLLASGGADRAVKVWDVASGDRLYTLGESTDWVYAVAWSPDGKHLAAAGVDRSIRVWDVDAKGGRVAHSVFAHEAPVTRLVYSRDGKTLYSLAEDGGVKAWVAETMVERRVYPRQPGTPLTIAIHEGRKELAIGRFDGALVLLGLDDGKPMRRLLPVRLAPVLEKLTPSTLVRGETTEVTFTGKNLKGALLEANLAPLDWAEVKSSATSVTLRITVHRAAPLGSYHFALKSETSTSDKLPVRVARYAERREAEPNESPRTGQLVKLPATLSGAIGRDGDLDWYRFEAKAGQEVGVQMQHDGAGLDPLLRLVDPDGNTVAESANLLLGHTCARAGTYALGVRDREYRGNPGMRYRLHVGDVPVVTSVFPLGLQRGTEATIDLRGVNLGGRRTARVKVPATAQPGSRLPIPLPPGGETPLGLTELVVGEFPEVMPPECKDIPQQAPFTANGIINDPGWAQTWRFRARKGERLVLEINAARVGSPLDSRIELLDAAGKPLPRATLRSLARTFVAFRDHDSRGPGIRMETWSEMAVNDHLLVGGELLRIRALPRNPDDDCQFFAEQGQRVGFLGTTPTFQSQATPMYKVAIHPPGTTFPPNGLPVVTLYWRNDDGGPASGKDSRLAFDPPADGVYQVRVADSRGEGGPAHAYRLTVRPPRPDFSVSFNSAGQVSKGGAVPMRVSVSRADEFDGPLDLKLTGLPPGFHAPATNVPAGENGTAFALYAEAKAAAPSKPVTLTLEARATIGGKEVVRTATAPLPKLIEPGDVVTTTEESEATIRPGGEASVTVRVERRNGFAGRIPLEVEGLPHGVRVLDVGLNGILVTEAERRRTFVLYCEPWVKPMNHPIVVLAKREGRNTEHAAKSVLLRVAK